MTGAVIVGGGAAGAAAAIHLARAGRQVTVLEREAAPADKVCGDFLSVEAGAQAAALGLDLATLGAAPIGGLRLIHRARPVAEAALPFAAAGLSRRRLDAALLERAVALGATLRRGVRVQEMRRRGGQFELATRDGAWPAGTLFLATGKHELRGAARPVRAPRSVAFKTYLRLRPAATEALRGHVELLLFAGGYAGLLLVEDGVANLSLVLSAAGFDAAGGTWDALLRRLAADCPWLAGRLDGAVPLLPRPLAVSRIPYGFSYAPRPGDPAGLYRLGDQAAVIPSFTGDGVAIALHTAGLAAAACLAGTPGALYHAGLRRHLRGQMRRAAAVQALCLAPWLQGPVAAICRTAPGLLRLAASWTRIAGTG